MKQSVTLAAALWAISLAWLAFGPHDPGVHRTLVALAVVATLGAWVKSCVADAALMLRTGYWAGKGVRGDGGDQRP